MTQSTSAMVSTDGGSSWQQVQSTPGTTVRSYWPPRRMAEIVALPDESVVLCGGHDFGSAIGVYAGNGISDVRIGFPDCWRSWDYGTHWRQVLTPEGSGTLEFGPTSLGALKHLGNGTVLSIGGQARTDDMRWPTGTSNATFCLRKPITRHVVAGTKVAAQGLPLLCPRGGLRNSSQCLPPMHSNHPFEMKILVELATTASVASIRRSGIVDSSQSTLQVLTTANGSAVRIPGSIVDVADGGVAGSPFAGGKEYYHMFREFPRTAATEAMHLHWADARSQRNQSYSSVLNGAHGSLGIAQASRFVVKADGQSLGMPQLLVSQPDLADLDLIMQSQANEQRYLRVQCLGCLGVGEMLLPRQVDIVFQNGSVMHPSRHSLLPQGDESHGTGLRLRVRGEMPIASYMRGAKAFVQFGGDPSRRSHVSLVVGRSAIGRMPHDDARIDAAAANGMPTPTEE